MGIIVRCRDLCSVDYVSGNSRYSCFDTRLWVYREKKREKKLNTIIIIIIVIIMK